HVSRGFDRIRIYREFNTDFDSPVRLGISTAAPKERLEDDGRNLAVVLQELDYLQLLHRIESSLKQFYDRFQNIKIRPDAGRALLTVREEGLTHPLPAARLSDGTLKFICLMTALIDPEPPPLICIEEPEVGLHPDAVRLVGEALQRASERTQLIVTTHSEA